MQEAAVYTRKVATELGEVVEYRVYCAGKYRGTLREDIIQFKFHKRTDLGCVLGEYVYNNLPKECDLKDYDYLLPVPSKPSSFEERGYDTVRLMGEPLSELCRLPLASDILKASDRLRQTRIPENQRPLNIKGAFHLINPSHVIEKSFLVLDDVSKTGSTLDEVIRTLSKATPRQLDALVLAKAGRVT